MELWLPDATYNHPIWSRVRESEFIYTKGIWALEIFNYDTVNESATGYDETYWDVMLREGIPMLGFASDDNHNEGLFDDSCGGYIVVKADRLDREEILKNMLAGNYYSSAGPEIYDWGIRDGIAYVDCSDVFRIDFIAGNDVNDGTSHVCKDYEETIRYGEYVLKGHDYHMHTEFSTDSEAPVGSMIEAAIQKGLTEICLTDHYDQDYPEVPDVEEKSSL